MTSQQPFRDRTEAGKALARLLAEHADQPDVVVLGLPRGGVPVALEVALALRAPLDIFLVRKLGLPEHPELAMGAIASGGVEVLNQDILRSYGVTAAAIARVADREREELRRRETLYRRGRTPVAISGNEILLVDDGLATGASMRAAIAAVRGHRPSRLTVAVPVGAPDTCAALSEQVDDLVCPLQPEPFHAVGVWYENFAATTDEEVQDCLERGRLPQKGEIRH